jgi:hypothetical protein
MLGSMLSNAANWEYREVFEPVCALFVKEESQVHVEAGQSGLGQDLKVDLVGDNLQLESERIDAGLLSL